MKNQILTKILQKLFFKKIHQLATRKFEEQLFQNSMIQNQFVQNGFVHLKNILSNEHIQQLKTIYTTIQLHPEFKSTNYFINSVSFESKKIKDFTWNEVSKVIQPELYSFLQVDKLRFPISIGFCINPANSVCGSRAHQDPNLVDENSAYSIVLWIPVTDSTIENGCLQVLQGSHLWGNHLRSNYHIDWKFDAFTDTIIQQNLKPIPAEPGDIICFDPALIHASTPNKTDKERIAIQISTTPKSQKLITVVQENGFPFPLAKYYNIDEKYFTEESVAQLPSEKYEIIKTEKINYYYTADSINKLIHASNRND